MKTRPYRFQAEDVRRIQRDFGGRCLLASEVGTGKTFVSLLWAHRFLPPDPPGPVVVVAPAHLKLVWKREAHTHLGIRVEMLSGRRVPDDKPPPADPNQVYVVNYDILSPPHWKPRTPPPARSWVAWLAALRPRLVIADEGHYCGNVASTRTRAVRHLARGVPHVLILTGTPFTNKPMGLWPLVNIVRPELFPSRFDYGTTFTYARKRFWGWEFPGARRLDELHATLSESVMIRRRKVDVLDQLPPLTRSVVPIPVDLREYRRAEADYVGWLAKISPTLAKSAAKAAELAKLNGLKRLAGILKLDGVIRWVRDFMDDTDAKLLLGAVHYAVTEPIVAEFGKRAAVLVDGRADARRKNTAFDRFNADPACRLLVGNLDAAGTGWSCRSTSEVALAELPWTPGQVTQFIGRVFGLKRGLPGVAVHARFLVAAGTLEEDLIELLQRKQNWQDDAIDGGKSSDFDILNALQRAIGDRHGRKVVTDRGF